MIYIVVALIGLVIFLSTMVEVTEVSRRDNKLLESVELLRIFPRRFLFETNQEQTYNDAVWKNSPSISRSRFSVVKSKTFPLSLLFRVSKLNKKNEDYTIGETTPLHDNVRTYLVHLSTNAIRRKLSRALLDLNARQSNKSVVYSLSAFGWEEYERSEYSKNHKYVYSEEVGKSLFEDFERFEGARETYHSMGIPWNRGYLLHGEPGNGKTSFIKYLVGKYKMPVFVMSGFQALSKRDLDGSIKNIPSQLRVVYGPEKSEMCPPYILLFEDIDSVLEGRSVDGAMSFSDLANFLDGAKDADGRITVFTTNRLRNIDPALLRPGRIDVVVEIQHPTDNQIKQLFCAITGEEDRAEKFLEDLNRKSNEKKDKDGLREVKPSMAVVQSEIIRYQLDKIY